MNYFMGIDPGISGSGVVMDERCEIHSIMKFKESERDISDWFEAWGNGCRRIEAVIERVAAMPKQGVASTFKFGQSFGFLRGMLIAHKIPFLSVPPGRWQQKMNCLTKGDKKVTYRKAQELFPEIKVTHAIADALLIAEYARKTARYEQSHP